MNLTIENDNQMKQLEKNNNRANELATYLEEKEKDLLEISTTSRYEISTLKSALDTANGKISELENNLRSTISNIDSKDEELIKLKFTVKEKDMKKSILESEINHLKDSHDSYDIQKESEIQELKGVIDEKDDLITAQSIRLKEVEEKLELLKPPELGTLDFSRTICPSCEAVGKNIKSVDDKNKVIGYIGGIQKYVK